MKEIVDLLTRRDKRVLIVLAVVLAVFLVFDVFVAQARKGRYFAALESRSQADSTYQKAQAQLDSKREEWGQWEEAMADLGALRKEYLYSKAVVATQMRLDLEKILQQTGFFVPAMDYEYEEFEREKLEKVRISFMITGPYDRIKRFIHAVENFPKFLVLEGVDFLDIAAGSAILKLRIHLAGYYE